MDIPDPFLEEQYSDHSSTEVLLFLHVCSQAVLLDESNIAFFASKFIFCHLGVIPLKQSRRNNDLTNLLRGFCCFLLVCSKIVFLNKSNIAIFAFEISF